ncbi:uncharacterized protein LOC129771384 [Toxorhynchites rutilus septentrionalis]|uniref:uncharacterized protein LOC129771384 n=1 Tax=Toxorhynchites rutilus septentrionalis TaxID=329112 RepID=UPI002478D95A|nr:uncharacterized protein LOC129771384 [Toxorhynchites rutilus septentrionalis]
MRPGPGLVVMALAFISGARRGTSQQSSAIEGRKLGEFEEDNTEALSRINPWLSACDLAQPNTAPDLQGQCSAGTLPVAWIDEGPGPPRCPPPCMAKSNNKNSIFKANNIDNTKYNMENRLNDKQQCLDYLGDKEELSPAQICKKSSQSIETKLRTTRLRHCCERTVDSALHNEAFAAVLRGGPDCVRMLSDLLETDALAARITCEFTEVLVRYDCGQRYSIIHHCEDCKEAYRRWGCTIFLPYFATRDDLVHDTMSSQSRDDSGGSGTSGGSSKSVNNKTGSDGDRATQGKSNANYRGDTSNKQTEPNLSDANKQQLVKNISINVKSSRRKTQRVRIRPCLDVCQTVEQKCPYMLPGDRAPAYPTQYAGEPTFLCQDLNIGETGEQTMKSNSGHEDCCYRHCEANPLSGVCAKCDPLLQDEPDDGSGSGDDGANGRAQLDKVATANKTSSNTTSLHSSSSSSNDISRSRSSTTTRNILAEVMFSSQLPPRLRTCPSISSATMTALQQSGQCRAAQQSVSSPEQQEPRAVDGSTSSPGSSGVGLWTTPASSVASSISSSSASSLASSSSFIKLSSVKAVYNTYFNNSWTMRLRCLDEFVAWTKILLQLAGL